MGFNEVTAAGQTFTENTEVFGEAFTYTAPGGNTSISLVGIFNQVEIEYRFSEFSNKQLTGLMCVSSKPQWGSTVPADRGTVTYNGIGYIIEKVDGTKSPSEPSYGLTLKNLT